MPSSIKEFDSLIGKEINLIFVESRSKDKNGNPYINLTFEPAAKKAKVEEKKTVKSSESKKEDDIDWG